MSQEKFDVVVVGGGPSGATLAAQLAHHGLSVAMMDKRHLEGQAYLETKPCGGGLDARFWKLLAEGVSAEDAKIAIEPHEINALVVRHNGGHQYTHVYEEPFLHMGMRERIDGFLAAAAARNGVKIFNGTVNTIIDHGSEYEVKGEQSVFGRYLVGADGSYSVVSRLTNISPNPQVFLASEWECEVSDSHMWEEWQHKALIDTRIYPMGYGWIFPKHNGHLSIGWGLPHAAGKKLREMTVRLFQDNGIEGKIKKQAHWVPFNRGGTISRDRIILIGDAAGVCNPGNGGGISPAMESSYLAGAAIINDLEHPGTLAFIYEKMIKELMIKKYRDAEAMRNYLLLKTAANPDKAAKDPSLWNWFVGDLNDTITYSEWSNTYPWRRFIGGLVNPFVNKVFSRI